jgi:hypothetical protein
MNLFNLFRSAEARLPVDDTPSLRKLAFVLRHPEEWPKGFVWDYKFCTSCAIGLASRMWRQIDAAHNTSAPNLPVSRMAQHFAIPYDVALKIFFQATPKKRDHSNTTPEDVARLIDAYLATRLPAAEQPIPDPAPAIEPANS